MAPLTLLLVSSAWGSSQEESGPGCLPLRNLVAQNKVEPIAFKDFFSRVKDTSTGKYSVGGGIRSLAVLDRYSSHIEEELTDLAAHLSNRARREMVFTLGSAQVGATDARLAIETGSMDAAQRIHKHLETLIQAHNAWAAEDPASRKSIPTQNLGTEEGMKIAIETLKKASELIPFRDFFSLTQDPNSDKSILSGGILALDYLPRARSQIASELAHLAAHLPARERQEIQGAFSGRDKVKETDGILALNTQKENSARRIQRQLQAIIRAHNKWAQGDPTTRTLIPTEKLGTEVGVQRALKTLQEASSPNRLLSDDFFGASAEPNSENRVSGGILAIKTLPDYSTALDSQLEALAAHLPPERKAEIATAVGENKVTSRDGSTALFSGVKKAAQRIQLHLGALIHAHNLWAEEDPANRKTIPTQDLFTEKKMTEAIKVLQGASQKAKRGFERETQLIPLNDFFQISIDPSTHKKTVTGGILALKDLKKYSTQAHQVLEGLSRHLSMDEQSRVWNSVDENKIGATDVAQAIYRSNQSCATRIHQYLTALIEAHNAWAAKDPANRKRISSENLGTEEGMRNALQILIEASSPTERGPS